jgi:autotransporter passenger strand-loop-strand repeat protein
VPPLSTTSAAVPASNVSISGGGTEFVSGIDVSGVVNDGGFQFLLSGGIASGTLLTDPGVQSVGSGATATSVDGGEQDVLSGGTAIATIVESGGGSPGLQVVESGGLASATTLSAGGAQIVEGGGDAEGTTVRSGGTLELLGGSMATRSRRAAFWKLLPDTRCPASRCRAGHAGSWQRRPRVGHRPV